MNNDTQLIEKRIDKSITSEIAVGARGGVSYSNAGQVMELAKMMAVSEVAVPTHLRGNPGACLAVAFQALDWGMSPFAVANKSYSVNNRMAYESQMINAVILNRAPIKGRLKYKYTGEGPTMQCTVSAETSDGDVVEYTSPMLKDIKVKNSPLWAQDPAQQIGYYASRAMCRRHFPDVILGVYTPEEMTEAEPRDITPAKQGKYEELKTRLNDLKAKEAESTPTTTPEAETSPVVDDAPLFAEAEVVPAEDQSQERPEPKVDELLTDFLLAVADMTEAGELVEARKQAEDFDSQDSKDEAKNAILKRANSLGLRWDKKAGTFISEG
jgi:hypothetical protein